MRNLRPDLSGALFVERSGTKKRERRADEGAQRINLKYISRNSKLFANRDSLNRFPWRRPLARKRWICRLGNGLLIWRPNNNIRLHTRDKIKSPTILIAVSNEFSRGWLGFRCASLQDFSKWWTEKGRSLKFLYFWEVFGKPISWRKDIHFSNSDLTYVPENYQRTRRLLL